MDTGNIYSFPHHLTWEFTSDKPVRSVFPLWPVYGLPMVVLHWIWSGIGTDEVPPQVVYYTLRILMFILSFVLEDWAIYDLVQSPRYRKLAVTLVASSYVTWTYQTHTFSNSVETLVVLWSLVMIQRILDNKVFSQLPSRRPLTEVQQQRDSLVSSAILGLLLTFGVFNRITFPAYVLVPCLYLVPHFLRKYDFLDPSNVYRESKLTNTDNSPFSPSPQQPFSQPSSPLPSTHPSINQPIPSSPPSSNPPRSPP